MSVVVAAWPDPAGVEECLTALEPQRDPVRDEVWVVAAASGGAGRGAHPWASWLEASPRLLVPQLWSLGIRAASRDVVALTTAHCVPAPGWLAALREGHARLAGPAIGGPIEPPRGGRPVDWATYFLRYSAWLGLDREQAVPDLAGDNASYKRAVLLAAPEVAEDGFWEHEFHGRLRRAGQQPVFLPQMRVALRRSPAFGAFVRQRLRHGRRFGSARLRAHGRLWRAAAVAGSPLIPVALLGKVLGRALRHGRDLGALCGVLPLIAAFALAWAVGEASAYAAPARRIQPARLGG